MNPSTSLTAQQQQQPLKISLTGAFGVGKTLWISRMVQQQVGFPANLNPYWKVGCERLWIKMLAQQEQY